MCPRCVAQTLLMCGQRGAEATRALSMTMHRQEAPAASDSIGRRCHVLLSSQTVLCAFLGMASHLHQPPHVLIVPKCSHACLVLGITLTMLGGMLSYSAHHFSRLRRPIGDALRPRSLQIQSAPSHDNHGRRLMCGKLREVAIAV